MSIAIESTSPQAGSHTRITVRATPPDASDPVRYVKLTLSGAFTFTDSLPVGSGGVATLSDDVQIPGVQGAVQVLATARTVGGSSGESTAQFVVQDSIRPSATFDLGGATGPASYAPGDSLQLTVNATDNVGVARVGYLIAAPDGQTGVGALRDSAAVSGASTRQAFRAAVPAEWAGATVPVTVFAVDGSGNRVELSGFQLTIVSAGVYGVPLPGVRDLVYDALRQRVYASRPQAREVAVVDLSGRPRVASSYAMPGSPRGLDLTPGGDSLVVGLHSESLGVVNLQTGAVDARQVLTPSPFGLTQYTDNVRVAANNRAVFTATFDGSGFGGAVRQFDLATRTVIGDPSVVDSRSVLVTEVVPLVASGDRQRVLGLIDDSCCAEEAFVYDAATGLFSANRGTVSVYGPQVAADATGHTFLIGKSLFGGDLSFVRTLQAPGASWSGPVALTPDGAYAFYGSANGVVKIRVADDVVAASYTLGDAPVRFAVAADGGTLVVATASSVFTVSLR